MHLLPQFTQGEISKINLRSGAVYHIPQTVLEPIIPDPIDSTVLQAVQGPQPPIYLPINSELYSGQGCGLGSC
jgi:hypothetical protein